MNSAARIEAFLEMMSAERGAAKNTLDSYRRDLEDASGEMTGGLAEAGTSDIRAYLDGVAAQGFAATSQARKLSVLRQFFKFLYAEGLRADDPTGTLDSPKRGRPLPKTMSEAETGRLLDRAAAEAADTSSGKAEQAAALRLHALVEVLYATGLRVSELVSLPVTVALRDERFFVVRGKGDKERMVPLSGKAREAM
ncbi:MAG: site-specific integrase, partial [Mesorhizobium sp.]|nr:site-specific integrase [Mesorhizobium sp.]